MTQLSHFGRRCYVFEEQLHVCTCRPILAKLWTIIIFTCACVGCLLMVLKSCAKRFIVSYYTLDFDIGLVIIAGVRFIIDKSLFWVYLGGARGQYQFGGLDYRNCKASYEAPLWWHAVTCDIQLDALTFQPKLHHECQTYNTCIQITVYNKNGGTGLLDRTTGLTVCIGGSYYCKSLQHATFLWAMQVATCSCKDTL